MVIFFPFFSNSLIFFPPFSTFIPYFSLLCFFFALLPKTIKEAAFKVRNPSFNEGKKVSARGETELTLAELGGIVKSNLFLSPLEI